jgi:hypothetical protein
MTIERDEKGRIKKGTSGNPAGRKEGTTNKRMTNKQVQDYIGKRKGHYFKMIEELAYTAMKPHVDEVDKETGEVKKVMNMAFDPKLSFTCFKELIGIDIQVDIFEYKKMQDKKKVGGGSSNKEDTSSETVGVADVLSLVNKK